MLYRMTKPSLELDQAIVDCLEVSGPMSVLAIATALEESAVAVDQRCFALERRAEVQHLGRGRYRVPDSDGPGTDERAVPSDTNHGND
jgi:hypothetical protein